MLHPHNTVQFSNKIEPTIDMFYNMDESQKHYCKFKKPATIDYIYCMIPFL